MWLLGLCPVLLSGFWTPLLFIFLFCHIGWSALWLSQTLLGLKLAHNGLQIGDVADLVAQNFQVTI